MTEPVNSLRKNDPMGLGLSMGCLDYNRTLHAEKTMIYSFFAINALFCHPFQNHHSHFIICLTRTSTMNLKSLSLLKYKTNDYTSVLYSTHTSYTMGIVLSG